MEWRAKTYKPTTLVTSCFSFLTHFDTLFGFLLPNGRDDGDSLSYRRLRNINNQLAIDHVERSGGAELPSRCTCTPLGKDDARVVVAVSFRRGWSALFASSRVATVIISPFQPWSTRTGNAVRPFFVPNL